MDDNGSGKVKADTSDPAFRWNPKAVGAALSIAAAAERKRLLVSREKRRVEWHALRVLAREVRHLRADAALLQQELANALGELEAMRTRIGRGPF